MVININTYKFLKEPTIEGITKALHKSHYTCYFKNKEDLKPKDALLFSLMKVKDVIHLKDVNVNKIIHPDNYDLNLSPKCDLTIKVTDAYGSIPWIIYEFSNGLNCFFIFPSKLAYTIA